MQNIQRLIELLGKHKDMPAKAHTKHEVAALLCKAGNVLGFWTVPEYEIVTTRGKQKIDVVWAERCGSGSDFVWKLVAAFEIEGNDVSPESIEKDLLSLTEASQAGAVVCAIVLFQVGPDRKAWGRRIQNPVDRVKEKLSQAGGIQVLQDEKLWDVLLEWENFIGQQSDEPNAAVLRSAILSFRSDGAPAPQS